MTAKKDKKEYLASFVPDSLKKAKQAKGVSQDDNKIKSIEDEISRISDELTKQNRDSLDAMYNIDEDNLSESMQSLISKTQNSIASIQTQADDNSASIELLTQWQGETNSTIASLDLKVNENTSSIELLTEWQGEANTSIASIKTQADANSASITALNTWKGTTSTTISQIQTNVSQNTADIKAFAEWKDGTGTDSLAGVIAEATADFATVGMIASVTDSAGDITAASIVAAVNDSGSSVVIAADKIDLTGYVTVSSLEDGEGSTNINNCNIYLNADQYCDSYSSIEFRKERDGDPSRYDTIGKIYTMDRGAQEFDSSRFALTISTDFFDVDGVSYDAALRLKAEGNASLESKYGMVYISASSREDYQDILMTATRGVIRMQAAFSGNDVGLNSGEITFCSDGIYYGSKLILAF